MNEAKQTFKDIFKENYLELKYCKCELCGKTKVQLKKHKNTKHATEHVKTIFQEEGD